MGSNEKYPQKRSTVSNFEDRFNLSEGRSSFSDQRLVQEVPNKTKNEVISKIQNRHIRQLFLPDLNDIFSIIFVSILFIAFKSYIFDIWVEEYTFIGLYNYFATNWSITYLSFFVLSYWCWRWGYSSLTHAMSVREKQAYRAYLDPSHVSVNINFFGLSVFLVLFIGNYLIGGLW